MWKYQVRTSGGDSAKSAWSGVVSAVASPQTAPGPPNLVTHATPAGFTIAWDRPEGRFVGEIDRYGVIAVDADEPGSFPRVMGVRAEQAEIGGLSPGHHYNIAVETWTSVGGGLPAAARAVTVGRGTPPVPEWVRPVALDDHTVGLTWAGHPDAAGYLLEVRRVRVSGASRRSSDRAVEEEARAPRLYDVVPRSRSPTLKHVFSSLRPSAYDFAFAVAAYNGNDESDMSEWQVARPLLLLDPSSAVGDAVHITLRYG